MTGAFEAAAADLFANPDVARDATYRPGGSGDGTSIRVIVRSLDRLLDVGEVRVQTATAMFDVRVAEIPDPRPGDTLAVDGDAFVVQAEPARDAEGLVWTLDSRPA